MEIKVSDLLNAREILERLFTSKLPPKTAFKVARIVKLANPELQTIQEQISAIIDKYATSDENGNKTITPGSEEFQQYVEEYKQIAEETITLNAAKLRVEELEPLDWITPEVMLILEPFLEMEEA